MFFIFQFVLSETKSSQTKSFGILDFEITRDHCLYFCAGDKSHFSLNAASIQSLQYLHYTTEFS